MDNLLSYQSIFSTDFMLFDDFLFNELISIVINVEETRVHRLLLVLKIIRTPYHQYIDRYFNDNNWLNHYNEIVFFQIFRMQKETFEKLLRVILENDTYNLIKKKYRGGNFPTHPEKGLLIFIWFLSKPDALNCIAEAFHVLPSTIMRLTNAFLYILKCLKTKYIFWPRTCEEFEELRGGFLRYPGAIGALDGCHINIKVSRDQHDSYADRYLSHSINLMAICNAHKVFTYVFIGFPGSAHDSRVFSNSIFVRDIERFGKQRYFPNEEYHILGDSAFPLASWLMKPYRDARTRVQRHHNYVLSADRVCIEHAFGILLGRWRRLHFINTYSVSKAIEIVTAACILHNYCYLNNDIWEGEMYDYNDVEEEHNPRLDMNFGAIKRDRIAENLM